MEDNVRARIAQHVGFKVEKVTDDAILIDDLGIDSLDCVVLTMAFEEDYGIEIPDEDALKAKTVGDVISYIKEKLS